MMFLLVLCSCKDKERVSENNSSILEQYTGDLKIKERVSIPIDQKGYYGSRQTHVVERNDSVYLYRENHFNNSIDVLNWTSKKNEKHIIFNEISLLGDAFLPLIGDSIFIATLAAGQIFMTKNGSITASAQPLLENGKRIRYVAENGYKPVQIGSEIFMYSPSNVLQQEPEFAMRPLLVSYDLNTEETRIRNVSYPKFFREHCWSEHQFELTYTKNHMDQLVISFQTNPTLYIYDPAQDSLVAEYDSARSKYAEEITPYPDCELGDIAAYFKYVKSVARYRSINYDKFRNIYYRIVSLPTEQPADGQRTHDIVMPLSIMVLDKDFNVITERKLPAYTYDPKDFFITIEGLWVSTANEGAEDFDEDALSYTLFTLEGN